MKTKTGLFFGSFNPIHMGHLIIANHIVEFENLDEIWFVVSPQNPLKENSSLADNHHRLKMTELAISGFSRFKSCSIEFELPKPSYTIHTLTVLSQRFPSHDFALIIGQDNLEIFDQWKDYDKILEHYPLLVYPRPGANTSIFQSHPKVKQVNAPLIEISSTSIRHCLAQEKDIRFFLPQGIFEYIRAHQLYQNI